MRALGLIPDRPATRERDKSERNYALHAPPVERRFGASSSDDIIQPVAWVRNQKRLPSCGGQSVAAGIDGVTMKEPWASAVSAWREAHRLQGEIEKIDQGTRLEYVFDGLESRGWDPYRAGEDEDREEAGLGAPDAGDDLADELFAADKRSAGLDRYRIFGFGATLLDAVDDALRRPDFAVTIGTGTRAPFFNLPDGATADERHLGGEADGHAMRVFARIIRSGVRFYGIQNSHGPEASGIYLPGGHHIGGCFWAHEVVIAKAWEIYAGQVKK